MTGSQSSDFVLDINGEAVTLAKAELIEGVDRLFFFLPNATWPDPEAKPLDLKLTLGIAGRKLAEWTIEAPPRGLVIEGETQLLAVPPAADATALAGIFAPAYETSVNAAKRDRFAAIATADAQAAGAGWLDLGLMAWRQGHPVAAGYFFGAAADADQTDAISVAWLGRLVLDLAPDNVPLITRLDQELGRRIDAARQRSSAIYAGFEAAQHDRDSWSASLSAEFEALNGKLQTAAESEAAGIRARQDKINGLIEYLNGEQAHQRAAIPTATPFATAVLVALRTQLARLAAGNEVAEISALNAALAAAEAAYSDPAQTYVDRTVRAVALLRRAEGANLYGRQVERQRADDPVRAERDALAKATDSERSAIEAARVDVLAQADAIEQNPALVDQRAAIDAALKEFDRLKQAFDQQDATYREDAKALEAERDGLGPNPTEAQLGAFNAKMEALNARIPAVNAAADAANAQAQVVDDLNAAYSDAVSAARQELFDPLNERIAAFNAMMQNLAALDQQLEPKDRRYMDVVYGRDEFLGLAFDELYHQLADDATPEVRNLLDAVDTALPVTGERHFADRKWCEAIDIRCDRCKGLATLSCGFAQMDVVDACKGGKAVPLAPLSDFGSGGMIGSCNGLIGISYLDVTWLTPEDSEGSGDVTGEEIDTRRRVASAVDQLTDPLFNDDCAIETAAAPVSDPADDGIPLDFAKDVVDKARQDHENYLAGRKLAEQLERLKQSQALYNDPTIRALADDISADPNAPGNADRLKGLAEVVAKQANLLIKQEIASGGSKEDWQTKAERISDMAKYGVTLAEDAGIDVGAVKELGNFSHGALSVLEGVRQGNGERIVDGLRDLAEVVEYSAPFLDLPGSAVAANLEFTRDGFNSATSALDQLNYVLGHPDDKNAMRELVARSDKVREVLDPKAWAKRELSAMGDRLIDKIPGVRTLYNWWTRSHEGPASCSP